MDISVIISTYNAPSSLRRTLWGYQAQSSTGFEVVIADDGSSHETRSVIDEFRREGMAIEHVWQPDKGFRKNRILNQAIAVASREYLVFTDGDCIPRKDFIANHLRLRRRGMFLAAGSHIDLPQSFHANITREDITSGRLFESDWLAARLPLSWTQRLRLAAGRVEGILNAASHRRRIFTGNGSSAWRCDAIAINGFDESLGHGSDDKDFGYRLSTYGVRSRMCKFSLITLHLDHDRSYSDDDAYRSFRLDAKQQQLKGIYWTDSGIQSSARQPA